MDFVAIFGAPSAVQSDNGLEFTDAVVKRRLFNVEEMENWPWETQTLPDCLKMLLNMRTRTLKMP